MASRQLGRVEECVLLLVAQHFYGGFAEDGEIERRALRRRIGEYELVRQRRLPTSRGARDDVKRKFGETAAHNFVEARDSGRQFVYLHFILCAHDFSPFPELRSSKAAPGHASRSRLNVKASPRKDKKQPE